MQPHRRDVCRAGVLGALALPFATACGPPEAADSTGSTDTTAGSGPKAAGSPYSLRLFLPHVGSRFRLAGGSSGAAASIDATLVRAIDRRGPGTGGGERFELTFETTGGAGGAAPGQDTYEVAHPSLGSFPLFVVPGPAASRQRYFAVFNLLAA